MFKEFTDEQTANLFDILCVMHKNAEIAKKMDNKQLKEYIINSDVYGKLKTVSLDCSILEEVLERIYKTTQEELAFSE